ncbi:MAG: ABC transporter permease [Prevotellaceae bacterium]|jgi:ABC-2 type transport system permease protein|nr:ABC transporter permease [Prevotellaceae bacterium]
MKSISLIIEREFMSRVRKRSFILITLLAPFLFAMAILIYAWIFSAKDTEIQQVKLIDNSAMIADKLPDADYFRFEKLPPTPLDSLKATYAASGEHYIILYIDGKLNELPANFALYSDRQTNGDLERYIKNTINNIIEDYKLRQYNIENLDEIMKDVNTNIDLRTIKWSKDGRDAETNTYLLMGISYVLAFLIYMFIFMFGMMVLRGVIEEKSNRIIEVIVSSVKPFELMIGKIIGIALVGMLQFLSWIILTAVFVFLAGFFIPKTGDAQALGELAQMQPDAQNQIFSIFATTFSNINITAILVSFLVFFVGGYLLYASMFASIASAVEAEADVQQLIMPVTIPLMLGMMLMMHTFQYPHSTLSFWASMIPFTSSMVMMARVPFGVPAWQLLLSAAILFATFIFFCRLAGKIYRVGILMYGKKHSLKEMWKWINYK